MHSEVKTDQLYRCELKTKRDVTDAKLVYGISNSVVVTIPFFRWSGPIFFVMNFIIMYVAVQFFQVGFSFICNVCLEIFLTSSNDLFCFVS